MNLTESTQSTASVVANGSVTTMLLIVARDTFYNMLPYLLLCLVIIVMDLYYGIKAATNWSEYADRIVDQ